jgi:hypothetical protein
MIRYALRCDKEHRFDSWFGSSADFDRLLAGRLISCAICGSPGVEKDLMAPAIGAPATAAPPSAAAPAEAANDTRPEPTLSAPASPAEQALAELRRRIESTSDDVGRDFAREARRIHDGRAPERSIIGQATGAEARALAEDGIPVARLPWSSVKTN